MSALEVASRNLYKETYILDLLHREVRVCRDADRLWPYIDDDHNRVCNISLQQVVDFLVRRAQLRTRVVPPNHPLTRYRPP